MYTVSKEEAGFVLRGDGSFLADLEHPAVIFSSSRGRKTLVQLGDRVDLEPIFTQLCATQLPVLGEGTAYHLADLPDDAEELEKLWNDNGYIDVMFSEKG